MVYLWSYFQEFKTLAIEAVNLETKTASHLCGWAWSHVLELKEVHKLPSLSLCLSLTFFFSVIALIPLCTENSYLLTLRYQNWWSGPDCLDFDLQDLHQPHVIPLFSDFWTKLALIIGFCSSQTWRLDIKIHPNLQITWVNSHNKYPLICPCILYPIDSGELWKLQGHLVSMMFWMRNFS